MEDVQSPEVEVKLELLNVGPRNFVFSEILEVLTTFNNTIFMNVECN
jgi:hypothetical protein